MSKRLFVGLELPESCRKTLAAANPGLPYLRWIPEHQIHLTLSFLGNVPFSAFDELEDALAGVRVPPFFLPIKGVGTFGGSKPKVLWAGVGTGHPHLFALHKHIQDAVIKAGLSPDLRPFHPHITLARTDPGLQARSLQPFLRKHAETEFGMWQVTGFTLFSSLLTPTGSVYTPEQHTEFPL